MDILTPLINEDIVIIQLKLNKLDYALHESEINFLRFQKHLLESLKYLIDDSERKFIQSFKQALMKLIEAENESNFPVLNSLECKTKTAIELMEYTNLWKR